MERTWMPKAAGILNIISGALFLLGGITVLGLLGQPTMAIPWANYAMYSMGLGGTPSTSFVTTFIVTLGMALVVPGVVSMLGGIYSIKRNLWGLALAGSISTFISFIFLGVPAIVLTALAKREFA
jgi:hypothetical protein